MAPNATMTGQWFVVPQVPAGNALAVHYAVKEATPDSAAYQQWQAAGYVETVTQAQAQAVAAKLNKDVAKQTAVPGLDNLHPLTGIDAVGDFFSRLTEPNTWLRIGEFAIGGILLYVALKAMFPGAVSSVTGPVKTAAKLGAAA
jgi:preprotein translocase subunit SecF